MKARVYPDGAAFLGYVVGIAFDPQLCLNINRRRGRQARVQVIEDYLAAQK